MKLISIKSFYIMCILFFVDFFSLVYSLTLNSKYFIKQSPLIPDSNEMTIGQFPEMAYDIYPGLQRHFLDLKYDPKMPGADLAQVEIGIGKALPGNAPWVGKTMKDIFTHANKIKIKENQQWRFNRLGK